MEKKVLVFDIWGDFAHFKRIETTTSPLTYPFPIGTALSGLVAAIIGLERDSYYEMFSRLNFAFGVRILNPIRKTRINLNFINTKYGFRLWDVIRHGKPPHTQIPLEFIRNPKYRIYLHISSSLADVHKKLKKYLEEHETVYTPYLGISELLANFRFIGEFDAKLTKIKGEEEIHSVISIPDIRIVLEEGKRYGREIIPLYMDKERRVIEYGDMIYEANSRSIRISEGSFYDVNGEHVIFF
jgi:CRISPR-associated protein Cas5h